MESEATSQKDGKNTDSPSPKSPVKPAIRWRIVTYFPWPSQVESKSWYSNHCKLCAIRRAMQLTTALEMRWRKPAGTAQWTIAKRRGHLNDTEIVATSGKDWSHIVKHHAH